MAFKKTGRRMYRKRKSTAWYNKKYSPMELAQNALAGVKYLKGIINAEHKYLDTTISGNISYAGSVTQLSSIPQGDTAVTRDGNSVKCNFVSLKGTITQHSSAINTFVRMILFVDKFNQGTAPTVTDVLVGNSDTQVVNYPLNRNNAGRFQILVDRVYPLSIEGSRTKTVSMFKKFSNHHIKFNGAAGTDEKQGQIYLLLVSNESASFPPVEVYSRIDFYDN